MHRRLPFIVAIEGPDNAGKSTLTRRLAAEFSRSGYPALAATSVDVTRPQTGPVLASQMRFIEANVTQATREDYWQLHELFARNRREFFDGEEQAALLNRHQFVFFDRYTLSGLVYAHLDGLGDEMRALEGDLAVFADLTIRLDLDPSVGMQREDFGSGFRESATYQERSCWAFRNMTADYPPAGRQVVIDASQTQEVVFRRAMETLRGLRKRCAS